MVAGNRSRKLLTTAWPVLIDDPKSPASIAWRYFTYCTKIGWSKP